jgi:allene oxide cyclase
MVDRGFAEMKEGFMQRNFRLGLALAAMAVLAIALSGTATAAGSSRSTVHVIEHAITDAVFDNSDHPGSILTFHNPVFDPTDKIQVGSDRGDCIRIDTAAGTWECRWTTFLAGGQITVEGPFNDTSDTVLSITGGTGVYSLARGQMKLISINNGAKYHFIFELNRGQAGD